MKRGAVIHSGGSAHFAAAQFQSFSQAPQAEEIVLPTLAEVEQIRRRAYEDGFSQGFAKGLSDAEQQTQSIQSLFDGVDDFLKNLTERYEGGFRSVLEQLLESVQTLSADELMERVSRAARFCTSGSSVSIRLSCADLESLESRLGSALRASGLLVSEIVADPSLRAGDFLIVHGGGEIRATVDEKLSSIKDALRGAL